MRDSSKFAESITIQGKSDMQQKAVHDVFVVLTQRDNKSPRNKSFAETRTLDKIGLEEDDKKKQLTLPMHMMNKTGDPSKASGGLHSQSVRDIHHRVQ